ncbi:MAG TPA: tyrosine-type recombinase/integrase [Tepidisphaeraceae bacterium]|jgi:integrase|nr:tyrosine-type recombinase/integrase [Tepidisphaeraceae bacterium]
MPKKGRPKKPYQTSWGEVVVGLTKCGDGRWRIVETEERFTEHDERRAIARFKRWQDSRAADQVLISVPSTAFPDKQSFRQAWEGDVHLIPAYGDQPARLEVQLPERVLWPWFHEQLTVRLGWVAEKVGMPELAGLARFDLPKPPIPVGKVRAGYQNHSTATKFAKQQALKSFNTLVEFSGAKTLDDLTDEKLLAFRKHIVKDSGMKSSGTITGFFSRIRSVIRIAGRELDAVQIDAFLSRCKAKLYSPPNNVVDDPRPISRTNFQKLLNGVDQTDVPQMWRAMLLMGLNAAMYMEDLCGLEWKSLDLEQGTYIARRKKRGRCLRVAMLWPETIAALGAVPRRGNSPYVFTSAHGTRYNKNCKINDFKDYREKIGVVDVTFSHVRDGAYTSAVHALGVDAKFAELLAGHKTGMKDKYVLRTPWIVKPATDAIYAAYFG